MSLKSTVSLQIQGKHHHIKTRKNRLIQSAGILLVAVFDSISSGKSVGEKIDYLRAPLSFTKVNGQTGASVNRLCDRAEFL